MNVPVLTLVAAVSVAMLAEARLSGRHEAALRAAGAVEPAHDVYPWMQVVYPAAFIAMAAEGWFRGVAFDAVCGWGLAIFAAGKAIKYWAIATLGPRWSFRVLVPPRSSLIGRGPYRWLRHPNYVGVAGELVGAAIFDHAWIAGPVGVAAFSLLMWRRVQIEENALAAGR